MVDKSFYTPIIKEQLPPDVFDIIKKDVLGYINNNEDKFSLTWNCPTLSTIKIPKKDNLYSSLLEKTLKNIIDKYHIEYGFPQCTLNLTDLWVNIAPPKAYQDIHTHLDFIRKFLFSGVLYINVNKNSGRLRLENPLKSLHHYMLPTPLMEDQLIQPQDGMLLCFPSWLRHEAQMNNSSEYRISVSWNIEAQI